MFAALRALCQQLLFALHHRQCQLADRAGGAEGALPDVGTCRLQPTLRINVEHVLNLPQAGFHQPLQLRQVLLLCGVVDDQAAQVVQQNRQTFDTGLVVKQVGVVAGEQEAALRRLGIEQARLDLVDPPDHLVGV